MDKMKFETPDMTAENIEKIAELFPNCVTEMRDENGKIKRGINFEMLKQMLSPDVVNGDECYEFTWVGKKASVVEAYKPIRKTLRPCPEESKDWDTTENLYIEGDNLEVLKLLQESYLGKVKMIYIDPPYNTGNDFIYADDCMRSQEEENEQMGMYDEDKNRLFKNTDSNGRFHSDWCSMMYPRLMLVRNLLADDGVIFISIDDNEQANLKKICDEIFGESNFIGTFKWNRVAKAPSLSNSIRIKYEYVLAYCKKIQIKLYGKESYNKQGPLWHLPNKRAELIFPAQSIRISQSFNKGFYGGTYQVELLDDMIYQDGYNKETVRILACSAWGQNKINEYVKEGNTFEIKKSPLTMYTDLSSDGNYIAPSDLISVEECGVKRNTDANEDMKKLDIPFDYSKPVSLVYYLIKIATTLEKDSIILDFFSGSATTAHAVMSLNAEDGGKRKFIMVQLPEKCDERSEAYKASYKNICEIGKERIRRAGELIKENINVLRPVGDEITNYEKMKGQVRIARTQGNGTTGRLNYAANASETFIDINTGKRTTYEYEESDPKDYYRFHPDNLDVGFRVLKLADSNMKDVYYAADDYTQDLLVGLESNIKDDRSELDLLFGCLIDWGLPLSLPYKSEQIEGCTVHTYNDGDLIACFDDNVPESVVKEIAKRKPLRAVFRDSGFADSPSKINVFEIFKLYMPEDADDINKRVRVI